MNSAKLPRQPLPHPPAHATSNLFLSLGTLPFLLSVVAGKLFMTTIEEVGQASEEVFRGDRLPILPFPAPAKEANSNTP